MGMVRRINEEGTTVILVEQSVNRAMRFGRALASSLSAVRCRFDGHHRRTFARRDDLSDPSSWVPLHGSELGDVTHACVSAPSYVVLQGIIIGLGYGCWRPDSSSSTAPTGWSTLPKVQVGVHCRCLLGQAHGRLPLRVLVRLGSLRHPCRGGGALSELVLRRLFTGLGSWSWWHHRLELCPH